MRLIATIFWVLLAAAALLTWSRYIASGLPRQPISMDGYSSQIGPITERLLTETIVPALCLLLAWSAKDRNSKRDRVALYLSWGLVFFGVAIAIAKMRP